MKGLQRVIFRSFMLQRIKGRGDKSFVPLVGIYQDTCYFDFLCPFSSNSPTVCIILCIGLGPGWHLLRGGTLLIKIEF